MAAAPNASDTLFFATLSKERNLGDLISQNYFAVSTALITLSLTFIYWEALPKPLPGIPYTKKSRWHPFGDAFDFVKYTKDTGEGFRWFATKAAEIQSPIFQVFLAPFSKPVVIVADIQEVIDMATRRTKEFDRGGFLTGWVGILFPEGTISMPSHDKFKDQRNIWSSTMTSQFLNSVSARTIHQHTSSLVKLWATKTQRADGRPFEVSDDLKQVTFDMVELAQLSLPLRPLTNSSLVSLLSLDFSWVLRRIWTAATGDNLGLITRRIKAAAATDDISDKGNRDEAVKFRNPSDLPEIVDACETLVEFLKSMRGSVWLSATKLWIRMTPSWNRAWRTKEAVILRLIETSRSRFGEAQCAMDEVFKRSAQFGAKGRSSSSHREMIDETFAYIIGGHETTQDTTKWSMKYLTANQDKQSKLRAALLEVWPDANAHNLPSYQAIVSSEHPYAEASIQELLRIALTAPSWHRRTTQDVVVLGHSIPAGIDVFGAPSIQSLDDMDDFDINPQLRSPTSKPRASGKWLRATKGLYQPERWLDANGDYDAYAGPMLPFGAGPRGCFGTVTPTGPKFENLDRIILIFLSFEFIPIPDVYASFRAEEVINRGPHITYIRPVLRT